MIENIYDISHKELNAIRLKIKDCSLIQVGWWDGWRYALTDKQGILSIKCLNVCREFIK